VLVVSGPELKSKWVGESEQNLRRIFLLARRSAPSLIIFDELDSFAARRGLYTGSGVEHSMVNQLLTEMDGFRPEELVFVVGTTNLVESLDPALLRPGRFEFHIHVPLPDADDRRAIFAIYDRAFALAMSEAALTRAVEITSAHEPTTPAGGVTGDHIQAICRAIARHRLREAVTGPTEPADVERAVAGGSGG
jgi:cell division protease FtsH